MNRVWYPYLGWNNYPTLFNLVRNNCKTRDGEEYGPKNIPAPFNQKQNDECDIFTTIEKTEVLELDLS